MQSVTTAAPQANRQKLSNLFARGYPFRCEAKNDTSNYDAQHVTRGSGRERRSVFVFKFTPTLPHNRLSAGGADQTLDSLALGEDRPFSRTHSPIR